MSLVGFSIRRAARRYIACAAVLLGACSGSGVGLDTNGQPISGSSSGGTVPLSADFDSIQANVFTPICSVCHIGASAPQGLMLDAQHSYNLLVNVPSTEVPTILRVDPGNPNNSYIIQKLKGIAAVGGQMPLGETPLPASTIAFIAQWISNGAPPGSAAAMARQFRVASLAPDDGDFLAEAPPRVIIGFSRELNATTVHALSVRLERMPDRTDTSAAVTVPTTATVPVGNTRAVLLTPNAPLPAGSYRVVLGGTSGAELAALDGERLSAPPRDANGDRVVSRFTVVSTP